MPPKTPTPTPRRHNCKVALRRRPCISAQLRYTIREMASRLAMLVVIAFFTWQHEAGAQPGSGSGWMLIAIPEHTIKSLYWQLSDETEVWTRIVPSGLDGSHLPIDLIASVRFKGKAARPAEPPTSVSVLVQASPIAALPYDVLSFVAVNERGERFDLVRSGMTAGLIPFNCADGCAPNAIHAQVNPALFLGLARSKTIAGTVLGLKYRLDAADTAALLQFARAMGLTS